MTGNVRKGIYWTIMLIMSVVFALNLTQQSATARRTTTYVHWYFASEMYVWNVEQAQWVYYDPLPESLNLLAQQGYAIVSVTPWRQEDGSKLYHVVATLGFTAPVQVHGSGTVEAASPCIDYDPNTPGVQGPYSTAVCDSNPASPTYGGWR